MNENQGDEISGLSREMLYWVEKQVGQGAQMVSVKSLKGGISSAVYGLKIKHGDTCHEAVLRQFTNAEWLREEPELALHETAALQAACAAGLPSPQWLACDPNGSACGLPSVLMTRLPGRVVLDPADLPEWLDGLAGTLASIHAVEVAPIEWSYFTYNEVPCLTVPAWTRVPEAWRWIIDRVQASAPTYQPQFIHRDYHPTNVLWQEGKVSGVVDWVNACMGPVGIDTGHCRLNLVQMYGVEAADAFLGSYIAADRRGGCDVNDPYWDMLCLIEMLPGPPEVYQGWPDLGLDALTPELLARRLDEYAESLVRKLASSVRPR
ncbi:aminoglycoside phosphotransferase family protein [Paenibacillus sp. MBLB2552]|uniref:Aminoglycoside phosphotransferase family protein n=1 Tax=Paenibacillus mellifer TaxID=2937794 RepID=A0A9X1Y2J7_9BACL|nr:aminoglycoside phosphotransferase family protein [Paenibacillus mellifer]MCK8488486.1 aminoglycoside phosphotransferase family protein [Paenibacillus mellifer]